MELKFRKLKADEIDCRVQKVYPNGLTLLLYKDARCDQNILDETVGAMNWQRHHNRDNGKNITVQDAIILKQAQKALKGDIRAAEFIRDTSGNRPTNEQRMDVAVDNGFIEALNAAVEEVEQCSNGSH